MQKSEKKFLRKLGWPKKNLITFKFIILDLTNNILKLLFGVIKQFFNFKCLCSVHQKKDFNNFGEICPRTLKNENADADVNRGLREKG